MKTCKFERSQNSKICKFERGLKHNKCNTSEVSKKQKSRQQKVGIWQLPICLRPQVTVEWRLSQAELLIYRRLRRACETGAGKLMDAWMHGCIGVRMITTVVRFYISSKGNLCMYRCMGPRIDGWMDGWMPRFMLECQFLQNASMGMYG